MEQNRVGEADRRALTELLCRPVTGWDPTKLLADHDTVGAMFQRQVLQEAVEAVLAAGWRPPPAVLTTEEELATCRPGTIAGRARSSPPETATRGS